MDDRITLTDLNQFTVVEVERLEDRTLVSGRLSKPGAIHRGQHVRLFISLHDDVPGQLIAINPDEATATLSVGTDFLHSAVVPGASLPIYDDYWFGRIQFVLDPSMSWTRMAFIAPDAFVEPAPTPGWRKWRVAQDGDENREDGQIVPGGWEHEHCQLCWGHIGSDGVPDGYVNGQGDWVCVQCYDRYVARRDLRVVIEGPDDDADAPATGHKHVSREVSRLIDEYDLAAIGRCLDGGGDVNVLNRYGWTPLMIASARGQETLIRLFLRAGADVNVVAATHGYTALALAAQAGYFEVVEMLLDAGASTAVPEALCGGSLLLFVKTGRASDHVRISERLRQAGAA